MWKGKQVSVVFPTYAEKNSIRRAIEEVLATGWVDEVVVVNNNAASGTSEEVAKTPAREIFESKQGYGHAIRRGLQEAQGDLIIVSEPDGTFAGKDVYKLLVYSDDFPVVFGTRTCTSLFAKGEYANMGMLIRYGNVAVAKLVEVLFNTSTLTDVGCTMRLLDRKVLETVKPAFRSGGSYFGLELMLSVFTSGIGFIQIPVSYRPRVGKSSVTGDLDKAIKLGFQMVVLVLRSWIRKVMSPCVRRQVNVGTDLTAAMFNE